MVALFGELISSLQDRDWLGVFWHGLKIAATIDVLVVLVVIILAAYRIYIKRDR